MSGQGTQTKVDGRESKREFVEEIDYYFENGLMVLTARFLERRGYCCANGCRHCPYGAGSNTQSK
ncbi:MAG: hypothetical protein IPN69_18980 [Acidobacteria bacterium]|nr:hypothetical protein [Acidobacteriota bacterium]MBK8150996.1 hypothetical protein [Acidobacteriota bacterium]MBK8812794.1 hypothetical protein [Acidobacteriota bacterium]